MHADAGFRETGRHRRFVLPAAGAFLGCSLGCLGLAVGAFGPTSVRFGDGPVTVALLAGAGHVLFAAVLTWAYVRHARVCRDPGALGPRRRPGSVTPGEPAGPARRSR